MLSEGDRTAARQTSQPRRFVILLFLRRSAFRDLQSPPACHLLRRSRHDNLEHAVVERRFRLISDCALRNRDKATEAPIAPLRAVHASPLGFLLLTTLAGDRDAIVGHIDADIVSFQARQVGSYDELVVPLLHFDVGRPHLDDRTKTRR